jgi:hypothetical protein
MMSKYEMTVDKLHEILGQIKSEGMGDLLVVLAFEGGHAMPITAINNPGVGAAGYLMSEEETKAAPDDTKQVIVLKGPMMSPVGWLDRELNRAGDADGEPVRNG